MSNFRDAVQSASASHDKPPRERRAFTSMFLTYARGIKLAWGKGLCRKRLAQTRELVYAHPPRGRTVAADPMGVEKMPLMSHKISMFQLNSIV